MRFLVTGGSGFLGRYVVRELIRQQFEVVCIVRNKNITDSCHGVIHCDLSETIPDLDGKLFDSVVHIAGKAHSVPTSPAEDALFYEVNDKGTLHLLKALESNDKSPKCFINISSVAVYGKETGENIDESTTLSANTPYGRSKINSERSVQEWCVAHHVNYYNLRLPLVAGNEPPGNLRSMMHAIKKGFYLQIKNNDARKSIVTAQDIAQLIPTLGSQESGNYNLCSDYHPTINEIEKALSKAMNLRIKWKISKKSIRLIGKIAIFLNSIGLKNSIALSIAKITSTLTFSDTKARKNLNWVSPNNIINFLSTLKITVNGK